MDTQIGGGQQKVSGGSLTHEFFIVVAMQPKRFNCQRNTHHAIMIRIV